MRALVYLIAAVLVIVLYHRPVGMLLVYLRDRHDFPRQVAAIHAAIAQEA